LQACGRCYAERVAITLKNPRDKVNAPRGAGWFSQRDTREGFPRRLALLPETRDSKIAITPRAVSPYDAPGTSSVCRMPGCLANAAALRANSVNASSYGRKKQIQISVHCRREFRRLPHQLCATSA
jgi:hypothetical protein